MDKNRLDLLIMIKRTFQDPDYDDNEEFDTESQNLGSNNRVLACFSEPIDKHLNKLYNCQKTSNT